MVYCRNVYSEPFARTDPAHLFNVILLSDRFSFEHVAKSSCYMVAQLKDPDLNVCEALLSLPESITKAKWFAAVRNRLEKVRRLFVVDTVVDPLTCFQEGRAHNE